MLARAVLVAVLLWTTTACGLLKLADAAPASDDGSVTPVPSDPPETLTIEQAVDRVLDGSVDFRFIVTGHGKAVSTTRGTYVPGQQGWASTTRFQHPTIRRKSATMHVTSVGGSTWMQMAEWPQPFRRCWLALEPGDGG